MRQADYDETIRPVDSGHQTRPVVLTRPVTPELRPVVLTRPVTPELRQVVLTRPETPELRPVVLTRRVPPEVLSAGLIGEESCNSPFAEKHTSDVRMCVRACVCVCVCVRACVCVGGGGGRVHTPSLLR